MPDRITVCSMTGFLAFLMLLVACEETSLPRPKGYFRIDLPEKEYVTLDSIFPFTFEYPSCAEITPDPYSPGNPYFINIYYPDFKGYVHLSYREVTGNLTELLEDTRLLAMKHIPRATAIRELPVMDPDHHVYGMIYDIRGSGTASPYQFYLTDSTRHFLRGALYFRVTPNNDSLAPVIDFIAGDIGHLLETIEWK
ncbi:MAG TPA: gliding motility lipoprotein GldD [Bacteroidales bacterium]|nr:gliding motility lipoprotein GldD [Bacteroidales bacterium]